MRSIDLNCDIGEGTGQEETLFPLLSSVNIACGAHAGDEEIMRKMVELSLLHGVAIGAHPSYPDRNHFGRIDMVKQGLHPRDLLPILQEQIYRLQKICKEFGTGIQHIKPHGALYNRAAYDNEVANIIIQVLGEINAGLRLYCLSGSLMATLATASGLRVAEEAFADRAYRDDGSLVPRTEPGALIEDPAMAIRQTMQIIRYNNLWLPSGKQIYLRADTICLHGDGVNASLLARLLHESIQAAGIKVCPPNL